MILSIKVQIYCNLNSLRWINTWIGTKNTLLRSGLSLLFQGCRTCLGWSLIIFWLFLHQKNNNPTYASLYCVWVLVHKECVWKTNGWVLVVFWRRLTWLIKAIFWMSTQCWRYGRNAGEIVLDNTIRIYHRWLFIHVVTIFSDTKQRCNWFQEGIFFTKSRFKYV